MEFFHIALLQIAPCDGLAENLEKGIRFCKQAKAMGADLALLDVYKRQGYGAAGGGGVHRVCVEDHQLQGLFPWGPEPLQQAGAVHALSLIHI